MFRVVFSTVKTDVTGWLEVLGLTCQAFRKTWAVTGWMTETEANDLYAMAKKDGLYGFVEQG